MPVSDGRLKGKMNIKVFFRESDGHAYVYSIAENEWIAFPVFDTGDPDWLNPTAFSDINLNWHDINKLKSWLEEKEKEL